MEHSRILVLADDLTGALEVGAKFALTGVPSQVRTAASLAPSDLQHMAGALVVDSETRHVGPAEAARRIRELACVAYSEGVSLVYKKTDSTLRGNIGAELAALIEAYAGSPLLYVPAYPQMGRTVKNGFLSVDGVLVGETSFARDPLNPVRESHIPLWISQECPLKIKAGRMQDLAIAETGSIAVCDGETDADVQAAAITFINSSTYRLAAGPSGFAAHLARLIDLPRSQPAQLPSGRNALIVNGSLHKLSLQQVEQAKREGFEAIHYQAISAGVADDSWVILEHESSSRAASLDYGKRLAKIVCQLLARSAVDLLIVFGGDTAYAIIEAMGNPTLFPLGEVLEGIPVSRIASKDLGPCGGHRRRDLYLITKAGGFGPLEVLATIRKSISER